MLNFLLSRNIAGVNENVEATACCNKSQDFFNAFFQRLPEHIYGGNSKSKKKLLTKKHAITNPYITINSPWWISAIILDIDHHYVGSLIHGNHLPIPTWIAYNRNNRKCHAVYMLVDPIPFKQASKATKRLLSATVAALKEALQADKVITWQKQLTKNPWREDIYELDLWGGFYQLSSLYYMIPSVFRRRQYDAPSQPSCVGVKCLDSYVDARQSRNCTVFDYVRHVAYREVDLYRDQGSFHEAVARTADAANSEASILFSGRGRLPCNEIKHLVKSVSGWTWTHRVTNSAECNRGVMKFRRMGGLSFNAWQKETRRRQSRAANRTNRIKRITTHTKIRKAVYTLLKQGIKVTTVSLSRITGLNRSTIYRLKSFVANAVSVYTPGGCRQGGIAPRSDSRRGLFHACAVNPRGVGARCAKSTLSASGVLLDDPSFFPDGVCLHGSVCGLRNKSAPGDSS